MYVEWQIFRWKNGKWAFLRIFPVFWPLPLTVLFIFDRSSAKTLQCIPQLSWKTIPKMKCIVEKKASKFQMRYVSVVNFCEKENPCVFYDFQFCIAMNNVEHVCQCVMTLPYEFCFSEERTSTASSSSSFENNDANEHLLDFVVTTVDQIDFSLYNAFESITNRVSTISVCTNTFLK